MENVNVEQPSYEQLAQAYQKVIGDYQSLNDAYNTIRMDRVLDRLKVMMQIAENKDAYPKKVYDLAIWHMLHIMEKPKKETNE